MPTKKPRRAKLPSCTVYAVKNHDGSWVGAYVPKRTFAAAHFFNVRPEVFDSQRVVPCRVRVLGSARKAPKRTR